MHSLSLVQVDIGPIPASSAKAWIDFARSRRNLKRGGEFKWTAEVDLEEVEYLVHAFYRVASRAADAAEQRGSRLMPPEGQAFYAALVLGVLDALESAGTPAAEFAGELRQFWPGFE